MKIEFFSESNIRYLSIIIKLKGTFVSIVLTSSIVSVDLHSARKETPINFQS